MDRLDADGTRVSGPESTRVHSGVDRLDADGTRVLGPESTNPATPLPPPPKNGLFGGRRRDFRPKSESRRSTIIVMPATLHDLPPNTYYGHWLAKNAGKHAAKWEAIARNETFASPGVAPFDVKERDFPGNRLLAR